MPQPQRKTDNKKKGLASRGLKATLSNTYVVHAVTDKGEKLSIKVPENPRWKQTDKSDVRIISVNKCMFRSAGRKNANIEALKPQSPIKVFAKGKIIDATITGVELAGPSTDVEPGKNTPIKKPGGH